jgi:hypothetical protein
MVAWLIPTMPLVLRVLFHTLVICWLRLVETEATMRGLPERVKEAMAEVGVGAQATRVAEEQADRLDRQV